MKTFEQFLEKKGMKKSDLENKTAAELAALHNEFVSETYNALVGLIDKKASAEEIIEFKKALDTMKDYPVLLEEHKTFMAEFKAFKETKKEVKGVPLAVEIKENKAAIKDIATGLKSDELQLKTLVQRSAITNNEQAYDLPDIGQLATRRLSLYDIFPKLTISGSNHNGVIRYYDWDEATIARAAAAVAEGAAFPQSTAKWKKGSITIQKVGDTIPVTEEFFEDEQMFAAELGMFLETNVNLEVDRQLADGDGTSNQIVGLKASVDAYTLPLTGTIQDANIYDLIVKLSEAITTTGGAKYKPDFAVMNISDINKMKLKKDANNNYLIPPFVSKDGSQVAAVLVLESNIITADTMVLGDRRFARIYEIGGVTISKGMINAQFTEDEMTLKIRKRLAFLIRACDKAGFLKVTSIDAALTALTAI